VPLPISPNPENLRYLRTKRDRMGHDLAQLEHYDQVGAGTEHPDGGAL
jgi:3,4-dihydroxy 2-butanone 4-phosphate synthase/GTP cyclohydrolase II